jgi:hypothetical protein
MLMMNSFVEVMVSYESMPPVDELVGADSFELD